MERLAPRIMCGAFRYLLQVTFANTGLSERDQIYTMVARNFFAFGMAIKVILRHGLRR